MDILMTDSEDETIVLFDGELDVIPEDGGLVILFPDFKVGDKTEQDRRIVESRTLVMYPEHARGPGWILTLRPETKEDRFPTLEDVERWITQFHVKDIAAWVRNQPDWPALKERRDSEKEREDA